MLTNIGTDYGGNKIDLDLIPLGSTIISAGVGEDISFDLGLIRAKECQVIGIDPTIKSKRYIERHKPENFVFINKSLVPESVANKKVRMYINKNPLHVSDSELAHHQAVSSSSYETDAITLDEILSIYDDISLIKLDIEGSEYGVVREMSVMDIPQIVIEFHHFCSDYSFNDTLIMVNKIISMGYHHFPKLDGAGQFVQTTFIKD